MTLVRLAGSEESSDSSWQQASCSVRLPPPIRQPAWHARSTCSYELEWMNLSWNCCHQPMAKRSWNQALALALLAALTCNAAAHSFGESGSYKNAAVPSDDSHGEDENSSGYYYEELSESQGTAALENAPLAWYTGAYVLRTLSLIGGEDVMEYLIRTLEDPSRLLDMNITSVASQFDFIIPGSNMRVYGYQTGPQSITVLEVEVLDTSPPPSFSGAPLVGAADSMEENDGTASLFSVGQGSVTFLPWKQARVVTEMKVLFMITSICGFGSAVSVEDFSKVIFEGPGSKARTLEGYFYECSQGVSTMNQSNSKIVGPIEIPCEYTGQDYAFLSGSESKCSNTNTEGWMRYASDQAASAFGVDLSQYSHRVLLMPAYYIYQVGCPYMGQGTLGPSTTLSTGTPYASVLLSGDLWKQPVAFMHELGHNNYMHHSAKGPGSCTYCDYSCVMGDCCDFRCMNPVHNWQLGWGKPMYVLSGQTMPVGAMQTYVMPTQQSTPVNMLIILPDWVPGYNTQFRGYGIFIGYRTDTGKYDSAMPADYLYATNIYYWDGQVQQMARYSWFNGSVGTGQEYRNSTYMLSVRQLEGNSQSATITVCRFDQEFETNCFDGVDNDCDGYVDSQDPDCLPNAVHTPLINNARPPRPTSPPPTTPDFPDSQNAMSSPPPPPDHPPSPPTPPSPKKWPKKPRPPRPPKKHKPPKPPAPKKKWPKKPKPPSPPSPMPPSPPTPPPPMTPAPVTKGKGWGKKPRPPKPPMPPKPPKNAWKFRPRPPPPVTDMEGGSKLEEIETDTAFLRGIEPWENAQIDMQPTDAALLSASTEEQRTCDQEPEQDGGSHYEYDPQEDADHVDPDAADDAEADDGDEPYQEYEYGAVDEEKMLEERAQASRRLEQEGVEEIFATETLRQLNQEGLEEVFATDPVRLVEQEGIDEVFATDAPRRLAQEGLEEVFATDAPRPPPFDMGEAGGKYAEDTWDALSVPGRNLVAGAARGAEGVQRELQQQSSSSETAFEDDMWGKVADPHRSTSEEDQQVDSEHVAHLEREQTDEQLEQAQEALRRWGQAVLDAAPDLGIDSKGRKLIAPASGENQSQLETAQALLRHDPLLRYRFKLVRNAPDGMRSAPKEKGKRVRV